MTIDEVFEEHPGAAGARRASGGLGGPCEAPHGQQEG